VRQLLKLIGWGTAAFMLLAIGQEWDFFKTAWFGAEEPAAAVPEVDRQEVEASLRETLVVIGHLYGSGGDQRFAERLPISQAILDEVIDDLRYLGRQHLVQEQTLTDLEILDLDPLSEDRVELRTREQWLVRMLSTTSQRAVGPAEAHVSHGRYLLSRGGKGWSVAAWEIVSPAASESASESQGPRE